MNLEKRKKMDKLYIDIAHRISKESYATRSKVGAVIVKNDNICSFGWNGTPAGYDNTCEMLDGTTNPIVIHAESNALQKLLKHGGTGTEGATLYLTLSPCYECSKMIYQAGIKRVVYLDEYRIIDGLNFLKEMGIEIEKFEIEYGPEFDFCA